MPGKETKGRQIVISAEREIYKEEEKRKRGEGEKRRECVI